MPLNLNTPETERSQYLTWDPALYEDYEEASAKIMKLAVKGFQLSKLDNKNGEAILQPPPRSEHDLVFRVLCENGDDRLIWDRRDAVQRVEAREQFDEYIKKGFTPYVCSRGGDKGSKLDSFDHLLEEIIFVPKTHPA